jgi:glycine/D-amino acid oxidase-like deaminating enzyme
MNAPSKFSYDVVIVGGAMIGSSCAWFLASNPDFTGSVLVVERDQSLEFASTTGTNSCIREQFSSELNIRISQFAFDYIADFPGALGDPEAPQIAHTESGYLFLATEAGAGVLRANRDVQATCGVGTQLLEPEEIARRYPFYNLENIALGSINPREGYFDGAAMHPWWRKKARQRGVEFIENEVVAMTRTGDRVIGVTLKSGEVVACGTVVNASGPRAVLTARMAGLEIPVEPRKRMTFIFSAATPPEGVMPLTILPEGVHCRADGPNFMTGCPPANDVAVDYDDFAETHELFEDHIWPTLAYRIPCFEAIKVVNSWACHYAYNTFDHNAVIGRHPEVPNFIFCNGFSGHGLQQSPAMGRGVSELIAHGGYRTLDLSPLGVERILRGEPIVEKAII